MHLKSISIASFAVLLLIGSLTGCAAALNEDPAARALQFLTNVHTGKSMNEEEWLTKEVRSAEVFRAHGGLEAMVKQSTAHARRYGGLESVQVVQCTTTGDTVDIQVRVLFKEMPAASADAPTSETEDMVWTIAAVKESGRWLLSF
jgi:hypothetical protein